jgi:hypothetical protein
MRTCVVFSSVVLILLVMVVAGCQRSTSSSGAKLAAPENACKAPPASWQGIIPGQSTKADVINTLGQPSVKEESWVKWRKDSFIYPPIKTLPGASYGDRIVFRNDGIVDWIDVWVSNVDGEFHTVAEDAQQYGCTLDRVYVGQVFDFSGPEQVYVWSECGIALTAVQAGLVKQSADEVLPLAELIEMDSDQLSFRHPVHPQASIQPRPNPQEIIIRKFIFQPTDFASFQKLYADQIPYLREKHFYQRFEK